MDTQILGFALVDFLILLAFGAVVGILAGRIMKTSTGFGILGDIILGLLGAVVGGWLFAFFGLAIVNTWVTLFVSALVGSIVLILLGRMLRR